MNAPISIVISAAAHEHLRAVCAISTDAVLRTIGRRLIGSHFISQTQARIVLEEADARRLLSDVPMHATLRDALAQIAAILNNRDSHADRYEAGQRWLKQLARA